METRTSIPLASWVGSAGFSVACRTISTAVRQQRNWSSRDPRPYGGETEVTLLVSDFLQGSAVGFTNYMGCQEALDRLEIDPVPQVIAAAKLGV